MFPPITPWEKPVAFQVATHSVRQADKNPDHPNQMPGEKK